MRTIGSLDWRGGDGAPALLIEGAIVVDPRSEMDGAHDLLIRDGRVAEIATPGSLDASDHPGAEVIDADGLHAFPAFFDPHVHLRVPGQEHREDVETGTRAAAAGGFC
ncbi:MAG TPA: dihydroorotase, partial [Solirubrobacterales bacterium]|nr:dihydroorotase [Solirubrobacterales bacterium]